MKNIFLYIHDEKGYGHLSRMIKIYHILKVDFDVCLLVSGTLKVLDPTIKCIYLPYATEFEPFGGNELELYKKKVNYRREFIKSTLANVSSFSLMIDYFPFGRYAFLEEIDLMIYFCHDKGGKVYSIVRDIFTGLPVRDKSYYKMVDEALKPYSAKASLRGKETKKLYEHGIINIFLNNYLESGKIDNILVFGNQELYDIRSEFNLSPCVQNKFIYFGYLNSASKILKVSKKSYVLVSMGGNIFSKNDFFKLLFVCKYLKNIHFKIVLGNMIDLPLVKVIKNKFVYSNIQFVDFTPNIGNLFAGAKIFIGGAGYGNCCDLLKYNIPSLLLINADEVIAVNYTEQAKRIEILSKYIPIYFIDVFGEKLAKTIIYYYNLDYELKKHDVFTNTEEQLLNFLGIKK